MRRSSLLTIILLASLSCTDAAAQLSPAFDGALKKLPGGGEHGPHSIR